MPETRKKKKSRKIKYRKVTFKLTDKQKKLIEKVCRAKKTTPTRLMKAAIREYLSHYARSASEEDYISENQLRLFDDDLLDDQEVENPSESDVA